MEIIILIIIGVILTVANYLLSSAVLLWVCKLFKIEKATYKLSLLIIFLTIVLGITVGLLIMLFVSLTGFKVLGQLLSVIASFLIFHFILKKYYQTKLGKNLVINIISSIFIVIFSLAIVIPIRYLVIQPFYINRASMEPTFVDRDYIMIKMYDKSYQRGDVVVFRYPKDPSQYFIKRIVGLPGEKVSFADGKTLINGQILDESNYLDKNVLTDPVVIEEFTVPADQYFLLGDNRVASLDSRRFGPIFKDLIIGKYWFTGLKSNQ